MPISERFQGANVVDAGRLSPYWGEHVARYVFAAPYAEGKTVLDIACGTGYGVGLLGRDAGFVVGVDVDADAARQALSECGVNAGVILGDGLELPFRENTFDVITTLETLEHLHERPAFIDDLHRVLKTDGVMVLSTPNANYTQPIDGKPENPFHIHEYTPVELEMELERRFEIIEFVGQSLNESVRVSPFVADQRRMPRDVGTQMRLFGWRIMNKLPYGLRETVSDAIWRKPFYPTEMDYNFSKDTIEKAPTLVAVCRKK